MAESRVLPDACVAFCVVILNVICGLLGAVIFCLAIWMRAEDDVRQWVIELEMYQYWNGLYILMAAGLLIMIISICGCMGAINGNRCLLATNMSLTSLGFLLVMFGAVILLANCIRPSMDQDRLAEDFNLILNRRNAVSDEFVIFLYWRSAAFMLVAFILELAGGIYILVNGTEYSKLDPWLERRMYKLILDSNYNDRANLALQAIQEKVGCCGSRNYQDFDRARLPIADHCRDAVTGNVYQEGCVRKFTDFIELRAGWIAGIALFVGFLQLILVVLTIMRCRAEPDDEGFTLKRKYDPVATSSG